MARITTVLVLCGCIMGDARDPSCPKPWKESNCLGSSGELAPGPAVKYKRDKITWKPGMKGHTHYKIDPKTTALFVIDPQKVYSACPKKLDVPSLVANPSEKDFDGHSPMCCENFFPAVRNANRLAAAARKLEIPVHAVAHVYRSTDGDDEVDNCGRLCDFDVLGWAKWPMAWNLWNAAMPWSAMVYKDDDTPDGFDVDYEKDFYSEKTTYSAFTKPVVKKLKEQGVDTVILTGFMTQYCITSGARHAHDLGFRVLVVKNAVDGPKILELVSGGVDENDVENLYLGVPVADTISTQKLLNELTGDDDSDDESDETSKLFSVKSRSDAHDWSVSSIAPVVLAGFVGAAIALVTQRLVTTKARSVGETGQRDLIRDAAVME